jgi:hypothetical protein
MNGFAIFSRIAFVILAASAVAGRFLSTCIPTLLGDSASIGLALGVGVIATAIEYKRANRPSDPVWGSRDGFGNIRGLSYLPVMRGLLRVVLPPIMVYASFSQVLPWAYNAKFGAPTEQTVTVSSVGYSRGLRCPQFSEVLLLYSRALCTRSSNPSELDVGVRVSIEGRGSIWGTNAERITAIPPLQ